MNEQNESQETTLDTSPFMQEGEREMPATGPEPEAALPNGPSVLTVRCRANASKKVNTRWGIVDFDKDGFAEMTVEPRDIMLLDQLQWLTPEDRTKYIGRSVPERKPTDEALSSARTKLKDLQQEHAMMKQGAMTRITELERENDMAAEEIERLAGIIASAEESKASQLAADGANKAEADKEAKSGKNKVKAKAKTRIKKPAKEAAE